MAQAVWQSPLLPISEEPGSDEIRPQETGRRFKFDFLAYLRTYNKRLQELVSKLEFFDFSAIKAALVASTPSRPNVHSNPDRETRWGWLGLSDVLRQVPVEEGPCQIVTQVSSIASLGNDDSWLRESLFASLSKNASQNTHAPRFSIVFPTPDEIRRTTDGYTCGGSIHMKTQSASQVRQLGYLRPLFCHWAGDQSNGAPDQASEPVREAGRRRAGPHIKTYLRFANEAMTRLDWAMTTSANLSKQAWGAAPNANGEVRICSYELGVVVWPGLWRKQAESKAEMVPVFKKDTVPSDEQSSAGRSDEPRPVKIGFRMPYDLPLVPYAQDDEPWCNSKAHTLPDWMGHVWQMP